MGCVFSFQSISRFLSISHPWGVIPPSDSSSASSLPLCSSPPSPSSLLCLTDLLKDREKKISLQNRNHPLDLLHPRLGKDSLAEPPAALAGADAHGEFFLRGQGESLGEAGGEVLGSLVPVKELDVPARGLILHHPNPEMLVPHAIDADAARAQRLEDLGPLGIDDEVDAVFHGLRLESELIHALLVLVVADGADEDEFGRGGKVGVGLEESGCCWCFAHGARRVDDFDRVGFPRRGARVAPEALHVALGPGGIGHDHVDAAADEGVELREEFPVDFFAFAQEALAEPGVQALVRFDFAVEAAEHVGGDGGVVDVGACCDRGGEEPFAQAECEGVSHCVDEDGEARVAGCEDPVAGGEVEEVDAGGTEVDVESIADVGEDLGFGSVVVPCVDYDECLWISKLCCFDCGEEDAFAASAGVTEGVEEADYSSSSSREVKDLRVLAGLGGVGVAAFRCASSSFSPAAALFRRSSRRCWVRLRSWAPKARVPWRGSAGGGGVDDLATLVGLLTTSQYTWVTKRCIHSVHQMVP
ncbi:UDP-Glycosyltransferase/glycogen phosphorylase [Hortaea werneckii]|nr:UDP-Glycosyltransferase/glycogen phosphorylase [Hortaea werneckii]